MGKRPADMLVKWRKPDWFWLFLEIWAIKNLRIRQVLVGFGGMNLVGWAILPAGYTIPTILNQFRAIVSLVRALSSAQKR